MENFPDLIVNFLKRSDINQCKLGTVFCLSFILLEGENSNLPTCFMIISNNFEIECIYAVSHFSIFKTFEA